MVNKIFWRIGQEITPATFIQADNYICSQHNLIRRLIAGKYYGLLPLEEAGTLSYTVKANLNNRDLYMEQLTCYGTTEAGYFVQFNPNMLTVLPRIQLSIPHSNANALYVVLRVNPYEQVLIEPVVNEEAPEAHSFYELDIREINQIEANELVILKLDNQSVSPVIDYDYIPPCMTINACPKLLETYNLLKLFFSEIMSHIKNKGYFTGTTSYPLSMLHDEFVEFSLSSPPIALIRLMKKIIRTCQFFISDIRTIDLPDLLHTYNHNDVSITFKSLLSYLQSIAKIIGEGEEDFTPRI